MSDITVAISDIRKVVKAFAGLAEISSALDMAARAESAVAASKVELAAIDAQIVDRRKTADDEERATATHYASLLANIANAEDAAKADAASHLASANVKYAKLIAINEGRLADMVERTTSATSKLAEATKHLDAVEAATEFAEKKLADIKAAIAAIAGR